MNLKKIVDLPEITDLTIGDKFIVNNGGAAKQIDANVFAKQTDFDALKTDYDELKTDFDALKTDYDELKTDYDAFKTDFDALKTNFDALASSAVSIYSGDAEPTADMGEDGDVYLVTEQVEG